MLPRINKSVVSQNIENEPIAVTPPRKHNRLVINILRITERGTQLDDLSKNGKMLPAAENRRH